MVLCHCYRIGCLGWRVISLLLVAPLVYIAGGTIGIYETLFGDISISKNATVAAERAFVFVRDSYIAGHTPSTFHVWGLVATSVYILGCLIYFVVMFNCIARECSSSVDDSPVGRARLIDASGSPAGDEENGVELDQLRRDYAQKRVDT